MDLAATALTMMESQGRRGTEAVSLQVRPELQLSVDCPRRAKPEMWMLAVAEGASATFRSVVGRLPRRVP